MEARSNTSTASTAVSSRRMRAASHAVFMCGNMTKVEACMAATRGQRQAAALVCRLNSDHDRNAEMEDTK